MVLAAVLYSGEVKSSTVGKKNPQKTHSESPANIWFRVVWFLQTSMTPVSSIQI